MRLYVPLLVVAFLAAFLASCREPPFQARFAVRGRWAGERALAYRLETGGGALEADAFTRAIRAALAEWEATGCASFRAAGPDETPALRFAWARDAHGDCLPFGADPARAHAGPVGPGTFVHFDSGRDWEDADELRRAALHEIGHVLGLDHSPDAESVMYPEPGPARARLSSGDIAAIHSLYGGGRPARGDLVVRGGEGELVLQRVAPPELTDWTLFDTDGDGDAEVVTWRTDAAGRGALWSYHFAPGPVLARTVGPSYGVSLPGASLAFLRNSRGERLLSVRPARGEPVVRVFDARGLLEPFAGEIPLATGRSSAAAGPRSADADGDGRTETVVRRE